MCASAIDGSCDAYYYNARLDRMVSANVAEITIKMNEMQNFPLICCFSSNLLKSEKTVIFKRENTIWHCFAVTESYGVKTVTF